MARNWGQGIAGHSSSAAPPSFLAASLIRSRQRSTALLVLRSLSKGRQIHARREFFDQDDVFQDVFESLSGVLEGTHGLGFYGSPNTRLERSFLDQIHRLPEQFRELNLDARHI